MAVIFIIVTIIIMINISLSSLKELLVWGGEQGWRICTFIKSFRSPGMYTRGKFYPKHAADTPPQ